MQEIINEGGAATIKKMDTQDSVNVDIYNDDESYTKKRKILLESLNLDSSPDFVYAKNNLLQKV